MGSMIGITAALALTVLGFYFLVLRSELLFKLLALNVASSGASLFLVAIGYRSGARAPIIGIGPGPFADPLPQALVLTAIVIHFATLALSLVYVIFLTEHEHSQDVRWLEQEER